jgi:hypothetical protein
VVIGAVTGGRDHWSTLAELEQLASGIVEHGVTLLRDGDCVTGVDRVARGFVRARGLAETEAWRADWDRYKKAAGPIRNRAMIGGSQPDMLGVQSDPRIGVLFAFTGGTGTADAVSVAVELGIPVVPIKRVREPRIWNSHFPTPPCPPVNVVKVGRPTPLGNPFKLEVVEGVSRAEAAAPLLEQYKRWLWDRTRPGPTQDPAVVAALDAITADDFLVCSCWPAHCHAEVIVRAWRFRQQRKAA